MTPSSSVAAGREDECGGGSMNFRDEDRARSELEQALAGGRADTVAATAMANIWPLFSSHYPLLVAAVT